MKHRKWIGKEEGMPISGEGSRRYYPSLQDRRKSRTRKEQAAVTLCLLFGIGSSAHSYIPKMEKIKFSETSLNFYLSAWCHIPEEGILHSYHLKNQNVTCFACVPKEWIIQSVSKFC
jgi:hypothetical protein